MRIELEEPKSTMNTFNNAEFFKVVYGNGTNEFKLNIDIVSVFFLNE